MELREDGTLEWILKRRRGADLIIGRLPTLPTKVLLVQAWQEAIGLGGDDEVKPYDVQALAWAFIGVCWESPTPPFSFTFRSMGRDAVGYGEAVMTTLMESGGYTNEGVPEVGRQIAKMVYDSVLAVYASKEEEVEGFGGAQN